MSIKNLQGSSVLLLAPCFFDYQNCIKKEMEKAGATVYLYDERCNPGFIDKILLRKLPILERRRINKAYKNISLKIPATIDYLFIINSEALTPNILKKLKQSHCIKKVILYMWDSFKNKKSAKKLLSLCDYKFTFDPKDAEKYDIKFRPLFFIDKFNAEANKKTNKSQEKKYKYDLCFIGSGHSDRCRIVKSLFKNKNRFSFLYFPSSKLFYLRKILDRRMDGINQTDVSFVGMKPEKIAEVNKISKAVLDIQHHAQIGLTMRTFELIGLQKKMVTTNAAVKNYDFYRENNIAVIDRSKPEISQKWLDKPYEKLPSSIYHKYSINGWLEEITEDL